ncbi:hypothetical protein CLU79DRAFT_121763 [Phycomyces nitens]|nr:hypothetical protein CLU79DRAFT_121763 [Phycomyces nitens]
MTHLTQRQITVWHWLPIWMLTTHPKTPSLGKPRLVWHLYSSQNGCFSLLLVRDSPGQGFPTVVNVLPIVSDFNFQISQAKANPLREGTDLCVQFSGQGQAISVIFKDREDTKNILADIKKRKDNAVSHGYSLEKNSHAWLDSYTKFASPRTMRKPPMRSNTLPLKAESSIPYVLPIQRQDTMAILNLKRTATTISKKVRNISTSRAKEHWIYARLMDQEDEFVTWKKAK